MSGIFKPPRKIINNYGRPMIALKSIEDFSYLVGMDVNTIIPFDDGTDELLQSGATILPRHYHIFIGVNDDEIQFKPYEYDQYRIVVSIYKCIIMSIDSIG